MMAARSEGAPAQVLAELHVAMNSHDLAAFVACFDPNYESEQPTALRLRSSPPRPRSLHRA